MKLVITKRKTEKLKKYCKRLFRKFCFSLITFCTYLVAIKVEDLFLAFFFYLLLRVLIGVDKKYVFETL